MKFTKLFYEQYKVLGTTLDQALYVFRPVTSGYFFYDILSTDPTELESALFPVSSSSRDFVFPKSFEQVFDFQMIKSQVEMKFFRPVAPPGFSALGLICAPSISKIPQNVLCVRTELLQESETAVINCFQPFGQFLQLFRTNLFNFDLVKPKSLFVTQDVYNEVNFLLPNITENFNIDLVLPLLEAGDNEYLEPQEEFDPARNLRIIQQQQQFGAQIKNPNMYELFAETDGEFIQSTNHFELIGVQSLNCVQEGQKEEYLYIYKPIAPPGYVALGLTMSKLIDPELEVFCIKEQFVMYTNQAEVLGKIYDQQTAIYVQELQQLEQLSQDEKNSRINNETKPEMKLIEMVIPKQGQYICAKAAEYPILKPEFVAMLKCQEYGSQKYIIKSFHIEPQQEMVCEIEQSDQLLQIFRQQLKKTSFNYFLYYYRLKPVQQAKILQDINTMTNYQKSLEPQKEVKADKLKKPDSQATNVTEQRVEQTLTVPLELQLVDSGHGYESCACSQPMGFRVLRSMTSTECQSVHFIELIAPAGYEPLSHVVHVGSLQNFNKNQFVCVAKIYLHELLLVNRQSFNNLQLKQYPLPVGTDEFYQSPYKVLNLGQTCFLIKDQIQTAYFQAEIKTYVPKFTLTDLFDKKQLEAQPRLKNMVEEQSQQFDLNQQLKVFNPTSSVFGSIVTENMADITGEQQEIQKFFTKFLVCDDFSKTMTGILTHPTGFTQLKGEINGQKCFKAICPDGYVALGDYIGSEPSVDKFVLVNEQLVEFKFCEQIEWLLTGLIDTDGIYVFQNIEMFKFVYLFEENLSELRIPVLSTSFLHYLIAQQTGYFMQDEQSSMFCPRSLLNYLQNYCANNKTTMNQQKLFDYNIHQFDGNCILDPVLQQKKCLMVSLGQFKLFGSQQRISPEMAKTYFSTQKTVVKKDVAPIPNLDQKILMVDNLIEIMLSLDYGKELIQEGRPNFFSMKMRRFQEGALEAVEKIRLGKQNEEAKGFMYPYEGYIITSDKIPISTEGALLEGRPAFFQLILKMFAKIVGGYKQLFDMEPVKIIELIMYVFGFRIGGKEVFTLYLQEDGSVKTTSDDECQQIIIGV